MGYRICITNTHGSHAGHTADYAAVQTDLAKAAGVFGKTVLESVSSEDVIGHAAEIRKAGGDRAFLRALHVASENNRVLQEADALKRQDMTAFLALVRRSGESSYKLLQNVYASSMPEKQELAVALAVSEIVLKHISEGVSRVHGGGFAGTIQAFVPDDLLAEYKEKTEALFGEGSCYVLAIRPVGGCDV